MEELTRVADNIEVDLVYMKLFESEAGSEVLKDALRHQQEMNQALQKQKEFWEDQASFEAWKNRDINDREVYVSKAHEYNIFAQENKAKEMAEQHQAEIAEL